MIRKNRKIFSLLLLIVFLTPAVVKLEHHHEHVLCSADYEKHSSVFHEKCSICNFEFSVFLAGLKKVESPKEKPLTTYCNNYQSSDFSDLTNFSFLLRAPPSVQN